jgi:hypothetical protein
MSTPLQQVQDQPSTPPASPAPNTRVSSAVWARPAGWSGWWSVRYARLFARTFGLSPPFDAVVVEQILANDPPFLFPEALDAIGSPAEPADRRGNQLPWRYERSLVRDILGTRGLAFGGIGMAIALSSVLLLQLNPPAAIKTPALDNIAPPKPELPNPPNLSRQDRPFDAPTQQNARGQDAKLQPDSNPQTQSPQSAPPNAQGNLKSNELSPALRRALDDATNPPNPFRQGRVLDLPTQQNVQRGQDAKPQPNSNPQPSSSQSAPLNAQRNLKSDAPLSSASPGASNSQVPNANLRKPDLSGSGLGATSPPDGQNLGGGGRASPK